MSQSDVNDMVKSDLFTPVNSTTIPLTKNQEVVTVIPDPILMLTDYWAKITPEHLDAFRQGVSSGRFGNNERNVIQLYKRLYDCLSLVSEQVIKGDDTKLVLKALQSIMALLGNSIDKNKTSDKPLNVIIPYISGFLTAYMKPGTNK